jgi:membrane associated rhomboid family serine protease
VSRPINLVVLLLIGLVALVAAGPTLVGVIHALVPLVIATGVVAGLLRVAWFFTNRW